MPCCCPGCSEETPHCLEKVKNPRGPGSVYSILLLAPPEIPPGILSPILPSSLPFCSLQISRGTTSSSWQGEAGKPCNQKQEDPWRTPKLWGLFLLPCADSTMVSVPPSPCELFPKPSTPDPPTILCQHVSRLLSSSSFPFIWGLALWLNGKVIVPV